MVILKNVTFEYVEAREKDLMTGSAIESIRYIVNTLL